jgi:hypothetical protein
MAIQAKIVQPQERPGYALLRVTGLDSRPDGLTVSVRRAQGPDSHLSEDGWRKTESWLAPVSTARRGEAIEMLLGPSIVDRCAASNVQITIREPDVGEVGRTVVAFGNLQTSGAGDGRAAVKDSPAAKPAPPPPPPPEPEPEPELPPKMEPPIELQAERRSVIEPEKPEPKGKGLWVSIAAALLLLVAAGGGWWWWNNRAQPPQEAVTPPPQTPPQQAGIDRTKPVRQLVKEFLDTNPSNAQKLAKGRDFLNAGLLEGAYLIWRDAAEAGDAEAALEFARFYDPADPIPYSPFPLNGATAASWYQKAVDSGKGAVQSTALRRLGTLYVQGGKELPADRAKGSEMLTRAAGAGDADAKRKLEELKGAGK